MLFAIKLYAHRDSIAKTSISTLPRTVFDFRNNLRIYNHKFIKIASPKKKNYSTSISEETLDESPFAYRKISDILPVIGETVEVEKILKPIYNFKADSIEK